MAVVPIFELPLVLLPGERLPLHIFEERYKRMTARSLEEGEPFGVVLRDEQEGAARSVGCMAEVEAVLERFDDGRLNIVVRGGSPFRVIDRFEAPDWPAGEVEELADEPGVEADPELAGEVREIFIELAERATGEAPSETELDGSDSYGIAARIELPAETKQMLLECRDEEERMTMLAAALAAVRAAIGRGDLIADRARSNGRVALEGRPG